MATDRLTFRTRAARASILATGIALALCAGQAQAATIAVDTVTDEFGTGAGCSAREAVEAANADTDFGGCTGSGAYGADVVDLGDGIYVLTRVGEDDTNSAGDLDVTGDLTLNGLPSAGHSALTGNLTTRVLDLRSGSLTVNDVEIREGVAAIGSGAGISTEPGTSLSLHGADVHDNSAGIDGGGIRARGSLTVADGSTVDDNVAGTANLGNAAGGGIAYQGDSSSDDLTVDDSVLTGNRAQNGNGVGGGIAIQVSAGGQGLSITSTELVGNGDASGTPPFGAARGGGVYMDAVAGDELTISDSRFFQNRVWIVAGGFAGGGGVFALEGDLILDSSEVDGNSATHMNASNAWGAGVYVGDDAAIDDSVISDNSSVANAFGQAFGAGVMNDGGTTVIRRSTISGNNAVGVVANGGGVTSGYMGASVTKLVNTTVSGNGAFSNDGDAARGGGVHVSSTGAAELIHTTLAENTAEIGGDAIRVDSGGALTTRGSILEADDANAVCSGTVTSPGDNIARGTSCNLDAVTLDNDIQGVDPFLLALADNGGPRAGVPGKLQPLRTHEMWTGPAIDHVPAARCDDENGDPLATDERGFPRPEPVNCDAGAYERWSCGGVGATMLGTDSGETITGTSNRDVIRARGGADTIDGGAGDDELCGDGGDDTFEQGSAPDGADDMNGADGTDRISYADRTNPVLVVPAAPGNSGESCPGSSCEGDDPLLIEEQEGGSGDDRLQGTAIADGLIGNDGDDLLIGGFEADALLGLGGNDTVSYEDRGSSGVTAEIGTLNGNGNGGDGAGDNLANGVENIIGTDGPDLLTGDAAANVLDGRGGDDEIAGAAGQDSLLLGAGDAIVAAQDGETDEIDCTGGGALTGTVDTSPHETYVDCPNEDGDALVDLVDACPTQAGPTADGCPLPPVVTPPPPATTQAAPKRCKKGQKLKKGRCVKKRKRKGRRS